ncbi:MAG: Smr/MutS family protein [Alphaproteobacteria bacterium]|nr:Smr/MutS family protein [Alphaproteobacteria bacterium]
MAKRTLTDEEKRLWNLFVKNVIPLSEDKKEIHDDFFQDEFQANIEISYSEPVKSENISSKKSLSAPIALEHGMTEALNKSTAKKFKNGRIPVDARLDLHGMILETAYSVLRDFIENSYYYGHRCVIVVTGKGSGGSQTLCSLVPRWLNEPVFRQKILSFSYTMKKHGGHGAIYILIKRHR